MAPRVCMETTVKIKSPSQEYAEVLELGLELDELIAVLTVDKLGNLGEPLEPVTGNQLCACMGHVLQAPIGIRPLLVLVLLLTVGHKQN